MRISGLMLCAGLLALLALMPTSAAAPASDASDDRPRVAQRAGGTCTQVVITLPDVAVLHGDRGPVTAAVRTRLAPGAYTIRYVPDKDAFVIGPWATMDAIVHITLPMPDPNLALYKAYLASMGEPVPLRVEAADARRVTSHSASAPGQTPSQNSTELGALSASDAMQLIDAAGASTRVQAWAGLMRDRAASTRVPSATNATLAEDIRRTLDEHKKRAGVASGPAPTTRQAVRNPTLQQAWSELPGWQKTLWRDYLDQYGDTADVTASADLQITHDVRLRMALRMSSRHVQPGMREAAEILFNDPVFLGSTVIGVSVYLAMWVAPEPFISKAAAVITTIGLVSLAGFTAAELTALAHAWLRLKSDAAGARSLADLERAAERFGKSLGGSALRILVALATLISSKALPGAQAGIPAGTPSAPAPARIVTSTRGVAAVAGAARAGWGIQVLPGGAMAIVPGAMAMSVVHASGKGSGSAGSAASGARSAKPSSQAAGGKAAATKAGKPGPDKGGKPTHTAGKAGKASKAAKAGPRPFKSFTYRNFRENLYRLTGRMPKDAHAHHVIPKEFANQCRKAGINIHDPRYGAWWQSSKHLSAASAYNAEWRRFFELNRTPSAEQILQFGRKIAAKHELTIHF